MSAGPLARRGFLTSALAAAEAWLLDPVEEPVEVAQPLVTTRPAVAVFGLGPGCGATTVARALGVELAERDPAGACAVSSRRRPKALSLSATPAARLARTLSGLPGAWAHSAGRLCLVECGDLGRLADAARYLAPLVLDSGRTDLGGAPAAVADRVVLVASPRVEPALASVARSSLGHASGDPLLVLSRFTGEAWEGGADLTLPESRMGAQLAQVGREPRGALGRAVAELADRCIGAGA